MDDPFLSHTNTGRSLPPPENNEICISPPPITSSSIPSPSHDPESLQSWLIDPNYTPSTSNLHRFKTAPAMTTISEIDHCSHDPNPLPQFGTPSVIKRA
ncbi:hypothetical protein AAHA92_11920 [Salvia divinorum]|uniref:Uncharacterized protein n=1 Tax=Salvia divinorum TaxID=28513 RepID=A0ABD1HJ98_SALDI